MGQFWALPQIWCSSWSVTDNRTQLWTREDASAKELEAGTSIHLTLDGFQPVDLALHLSATPPGLYGRRDREDVFLQAISKAD